MAENDPAHLDLLGRLVRPAPLADFAATLCRWLQDAHDAAAELQLHRRSNHRGGWSNNTSFGTDRYQYLLATAASLANDLPGLEVDSAFQSVLLKLPDAGVYQMQVASGPDGSLAQASDLRRDLLTTSGDPGLLSRRDIWLGQRQLLFLIWSGTEDAGLTGAWIGQGELYDNHIDWDWKANLVEVADSGQVGPVPAPRRAGQLDPTIFDVPEPVLPIRPRSHRPAGSTD
ncbi:hypothetical protein BLA60_30290 [Actinophytocola xinjiangensis]|uniref:Uncharacterized protein n=1 Tax=Actinophytocola xinjiangensis TaxID=485602 RepID=A0A7Z0WHH7_9PSEU|nr:hypothetical protein [Actinophytocola xinjiangensis]OLF06836.1 hypothetical protein BLA60_30290 [Actinophytocola xinjiangensis]